MKLAAKQVELSACPYVSEECKAQLAEVRRAARSAWSRSSPTGTKSRSATRCAVPPREDLLQQARPVHQGARRRRRDQAKVEPADKYTVTYVGMDLTLDGFAVEAHGRCRSVRGGSQSRARAQQTPDRLISPDAKVMAAGLAALTGEAPLICAADASNWEAMADLAKANKARPGRQGGFDSTRWPI